jgi:glycosyltransferase involved in cell wall biosynthesis
MPVYNGENTIQTSIGSILNQTLQDFKILVYDDGSTDGTIQKLESFGDSRIKIVSGGENKGGLYARSQIVPLIDTEYCVWLDDGDYLCRNDALERALAVAKSENYDMVTFGRVNYIDKEGRDHVVGGLRTPNDFMYFGDKLFEMHYPVEHSNILWSKIIKTELMKKCVPEGDILQKRFIGDELFFSGLLFFYTKRYCHLETEEPMWAHNYEIGSLGSRKDDVSEEYFNEKCEYKYNAIKYLYNKISAIRPLTNTEKVNLLKGVNLEALCIKIRMMRKNNDMQNARKLATVWHNWFCLDGFYVLNDFEGIENQSYSTYLEGVIYG